MKAPFPYFGGKSQITHIVWEALGDPKMYIEPFFGSGAVLLNRPPSLLSKKYEVINDKDGFIANIWRALQADPDAVAKVCDWPCNHADLSARKGFLIRNEAELLKNLIADPDYYDVKLAGYWIWAASHWIATGLTRQGARPHLTDDKGVGKVPQLANDSGVGVARNDMIYTWFNELQARLRYVKVVCGDWTRVCGGNWQTKNGACGIFFDPPYGVTDRDTSVYHHDSVSVAADVMAWCIKRGGHPDMRIVLAGYEEYEPLVLEHGWRKQGWKATGGYGVQGKKGTQGEANAHRETLYFSPYCITKKEGELF